MQTHTMHINKVFKQKQYGGFKENNNFCLAGDITVTEFKAEEEKKSLSTVWYDVLGFCNVWALL